MAYSFASGLAACAKDRAVDAARYLTPCAETPREQIDWMGFSVRTADWRYSVFCRWNGAALRPDFDRCAPAELYNHTRDQSLYDVDDNGEQENLAGRAGVEQRERELKALLMRRFHSKIAGWGGANSGNDKPPSSGSSAALKGDDAVPTASYCRWGGVKSQGPDAYMKLGAEEFPALIQRLREIGAIIATMEKLSGIKVKTDNTFVQSKTDDASWTVSAADSMANVMRTTTAEFGGATDHIDAVGVCTAAGLPAPLATVSLAQGESEGVQLVVRAHTNAAAHGLRWAASRSQHLAADGGGKGELEVRVNPVGFVHRGSFGSADAKACPFNTTSPACDTSHLSIDCGGRDCVHHPSECLGCSHVGSPIITAIDWWPYALLDFVNTTEVAANTSQPLFVTFKSTAETTPGLHTTTITLSDDAGKQHAVSIAVNVFKFALPAAHSLPTVWGLDDHRNQALWPEATKTWRNSFAQFFIDHRIPLTSLYDGQTYGFRSSPELTSPAGLNLLWKSGQRVLNVGTALPNKPTDIELESFLNATENGVATALAGGWPKENMMVYVLDEPTHTIVREFLPKISAAVKRRVGNVSVVTCGSDQLALRLGYNGTAPMLFPDVDVFIPRCWSYANTSAADLATIRAAGQSVGCYTSGIPDGPAGLNWYVEYPAIRSRIMLGTGAWSSGLDWFLYYRLNGWTQYERELDEVGRRRVGVGNVGPINASGVSPTCEVTAYSNANYSYDGEGQPILPGLHGVMSTLHFENMRDGLEDHAYLAYLHKLCPDDPAATSVPERLFQHIQASASPTELSFSEEPSVLRQWRLAIAKKIEAVVGGAKCGAWRSVALKTDDDDDKGSHVSTGGCCAAVTFADCFGFKAGGDSTTSIQSALDCPAAHTVIVKNMGSPWIVAPPGGDSLPNTTHCKTLANNKTECKTSWKVRTAINFTSASNKFVVFQPGVVVLAKRWSFRGVNDNLAYFGSHDCTTAATNVSIIGTGAVFRMQKADYQQLECQQSPSGICVCAGYPDSAPCAGACTMSPFCDTSSPQYDAQRCYIRSEQRHGLNIWCATDINIVGLRIESSGGDGIMTGGYEGAHLWQDFRM
jgi:hypothetical protein